MIDRIKAIVAQTSADNYKITNVKTMAHEFFFIDSKLEMNRIKEVEHTFLTIFKKIDDEKYLGSTSQEIHPNISDDEMIKIIDQMLYSAQFVKNPYYELPQPQKHVIKQNIKTDALNIAKNLIETVLKQDHVKDVSINSFEIFVNEKQVRILNGNKLDVSYDTLDSQAEIIITAKKDDKEVEIYRNITSSTCDAKALANEINEAFKIGKDRLIAKKTPTLNAIKVLLSERNVKTMLNYYVDMTNASSKYMQISQYDINQDIIDASVGDKINLEGKAHLDNSSKNGGYDDDGNPLIDRVLIKDNICVDFWGNQQFSYYLNKSKPAIFRNFAFSAGSHSYTEFMKEPYLHAVEFSDFQCNTATGDFAGELRLAYYYDGEKVIPVSGGSIAGNIKTSEKTMLLASELILCDNFQIPKYLCLDNVVITGCE